MNFINNLQNSRNLGETFSRIRPLPSCTRLKCVGSLLFLKGEIEQLTVSGEPGAVSEQCSPNRVPFYDSGGSDRASNELPSNDIELEEEGERNFVDNETSGFNSEDLRNVADMCHRALALVVQSERPADPDYLEEEYADLDWNEEQEVVLPVKSKVKQIKKPKKKISESRKKSDKG